MSSSRKVSGYSLEIDMSAEARLDNPIAQQLLVKQLQRYQLNVTATSNGNEAISGRIKLLLSLILLSELFTEWESRDPGYFTVALFDHRKWSCLRSSAALTFLFQICPYATVWRLPSGYGCWRTSGSAKLYYQVRYTPFHYGLRFS